MKCKNCGGVLVFNSGVAVCEICGATYKIDSFFENVDVHICYIESDSNGRRTKDSIIAQELYQKLEAKRVNTFYERISADNIIGDDLEKLRYSSIRNAEIVLVVGTSVDNFNLILEKYGQYFTDKTVIPFCSDIKPSDIPKDLSKLQAVDYSSIGWEKDLEKGILRLLGREKEIDLLDSYSKSKKVRIAILCAVVSVFLIAAGVFAFLYFDKQKNTEIPVSQTNQQIYDEAQNLLANGNCLDALDLFLQIPDYKDSLKQAENILDSYDGYYQTPDESFSVYFNIIDSSELSLEMTTVSSNGTAKATVNGIWEGKEQSYSFMDTYGNAGAVTVTLLNDSFSIIVQMENTGDFASIGNQNTEFKVSEKTDKPILQVTPEILLSWLQTPTTAEDITSLGFELVKDDNKNIGMGGGILEHSEKYRIASTDIQLFFYARDLENQDEFYNNALASNNEEGKYEQIICAVFATAEYLIPKEIGTQNRAFIENDTLFVSGGNSMDIEWNGDVYVRFTTDTLSYDPSGAIEADTPTGAICKKIVGRDLFVQSVVFHTKQTNGWHLELIEETDTHYIYGVSYSVYDPDTNGYIDKKYTYNIDKNTYEVVETIQIAEE